MVDDYFVRLYWRGPATVEPMRRAVLSGSRVGVSLPLGMHHAIFRHVQPDAWVGQPETVDRTGGAELVEALASITGLEPLAGLVALVEETGYRVHLRTPSPSLTLIPPDESSRPG